MSEHQSTLRRADPKEGFDRSEPNVLSIWGFTIGSIVILVIMLVALQQYFVKIWSDAVYEKVLTAPDAQLQMVRGRDDWDLTHYMYLEKKSGQVRIPVDQEHDLFLKEVAAGKTFYPGKPTLPKKEEPAAAAPGGPAPPANPGPITTKEAAPSKGTLRPGEPK